jgi:DNA repair photolyase
MPRDEEFPTLGGKVRHDMTALPITPIGLSESLALQPAGARPSRRLPRLVWVERQGPLLYLCPLGEADEVMSLNLARGSAYGYSFCSVPGNTSYPGQEELQAFTGTAERLDWELTFRRQKPRAVFLCPSSDPFPPFLDFQRETAKVVAVLARHGVQAWLMTRGFIRPAVLTALSEFPRTTRVTIGFTTLDSGRRRALEPLAAPPRLRLRQIKALRDRGFAVSVALEPLIPGATDTREDLLSLLNALAATGIRHISASYLFLRPGMRENLLTALKELGLPDTITEAYASGPMLAAPGESVARYLPKARRQHGYAALKALAAERGLTVSVSAVTNPDFPMARTPAVDDAPRRRLVPLFLQQTRPFHAGTN